MTKITDIPTGDGWIQHRPGDPMPVDGDTLIDVQYKNGNEEHAYKANKWDWDDCYAGYNVTAYRIHKPDTQLEYSKQTARHEKIKAEHEKEREMKYKAGDEVTVKFTIDPRWAKRLSEGDYVDTCFDETNIIAHQPAPEPVVGYVVVSNKGRVFCDENRPLSNGEIKFRYEVNPATKEVKAEVVE